MVRARLLAERHRAVRLVVAVLGVLGWLDHRHVRLDVGGQAGQRGAEAILEQVLQIHAAVPREEKTPHAHGRKAVG